MNFRIKALDIFKEQVENLDKKSKRIILRKIELIKKNPYRNKKIHSKKFSKVFSARLNIQSEETRMIYAVIEPYVILVCLLDRKRDYKNLEEYMKKLFKSSFT